jgi:hypothetical protein
MKKHIYTTLLALFVFSCVTAQDNPSAGSTFENRNILKLNLTSLSLTNIYLQDEYTLSKKSSVALGLSYMPERNLPKYITDNDSSGNSANLTFSGFSITPEFRWYFTGKAPKGFYLAPYLRYSKYTTTGYNFLYDKSGGQNNAYVTLDGDLSGVAIGLMAGSQWTIGNHFSIDWWILGAGFSSSKATFEGKSNEPLTQSDIDDIKSSINGTDLPFGTIESEVTSNLVKITYTSGLPGLRGFGLAIGYIF